MKIIVCELAQNKTYCEYELKNTKCSFNRCIAPSESCIAMTKVETSEKVCSNCQYRFQCWTS